MLPPRMLLSLDKNYDQTLFYNAVLGASKPLGYPSATHAHIVQQWRK